MLQIEHLRKSFDGFAAVDDANLQVAPGEVVAVIGPNGAGKTTLFNLITGQLVPDRGRLIFKGENIVGLPAHRICKKGISRSFQVVNIFARMTVFENVQAALLSRLGKTRQLFSAARKMAVPQTLQILESVGLADQRDCISASLSHGDQKVLEMAIALGVDPDLLILDEPTAGMSPEETAVVLELLKRLNCEMGLTILFCEHDMELVFAIARRIMVMQQGRSILQDTPPQVRCDARVQAAYLGGGDVC